MGGVVKGSGLFGKDSKENATVQSKNRSTTIEHPLKLGTKPQSASVFFVFSVRKTPK